MISDHEVWACPGWMYRYCLGLVFLCDPNFKLPGSTLSFRIMAVYNTSILVPSSWTQNKHIYICKKIVIKNVFNQNVATLNPYLWIL